MRASVGLIGVGAFGEFMLPYLLPLSLIHI